MRNAILMSCLLASAALVLAPAASAHSYVAIDWDSCYTALYPPNPDGHVGLQVGAGYAGPCVIVVEQTSNPVPTLILP